MARIAALLDREHPGWAEDTELVRTARTLSTSYTEARTLTPSGVALAYLAYFAPRTVAAARFVLTHVDLEGRDVLELGSGTGAASLVARAYGANSLCLIEPLDDARRLAAKLVGTDDVLQRSRAARDPSASIVLMAFSFEEIFSQRTASEAVAEIARLAPRARDVVIFGPGDKKSARRLQAFRDASIAAGFHAIAPCAHDAPCPALERKNDWCHGFIDRQLSERFERFAVDVGRDADRMALSYLVLSKVEPAARPDGLVVLSNGRAEKGRARALVCGDDGVRHVQALKRDGDAFKRIKKLARGDLLTASGERRGDTLHVSSS